MSLWALCPPALAQSTLYVAGSCGDDAWSGLSDVCQAPDGPKATLQAAIDAATSGDEVIVADGVYAGPGNRDLDFAGRNIVLRSAGGAEDCIIDCGGSHRAFLFHSGETPEAVVQGFTIRNGFAPWVPFGAQGGAVVCKASSPTLRQCRFFENTAAHGGAIHCGDVAAAHLIECVFESNTAYGAGWLFGFAYGGALLADSSSDILAERCEFVGNVAFFDNPDGSSGGLGGAVAAMDAEPEFRDCVFRDNSLGALHLSNCDTRILGCEFQDNIAALWIISGATDVRDSAFRANGGGLTAYDGNLIVANCVFSANWGQIGPAMYLSVGDSEPLIVDCHLTGNTGSHAVANDSGRPRFINCVFSDNAGAMYNGVGSEPFITNCTFMNNAAPWGGAIANMGFVDTGRFATARIRNSILWGNSPAQIANFNGGMALVTFSNILGGWPGQGNISADPQLENPADGRFSLLPGSPCIDAGRNADLPGDVVTDLAGAARFHDDPGTLDTGQLDPARPGLPVVDMGALEFQGDSTPPCPADWDNNGEVNSTDISAFITSWLSSVTNGDLLADFNNDEQVNSTDISAFITAWLDAITLGC